MAFHSLSMRDVLTNDVLLNLKILRKISKDDYVIVIYAFTTAVYNERFGETLGYNDSICCEAILALTVYYKILLGIQKDHDIELTNLTDKNPQLPVFDTWLKNGVYMDSDKQNEMIKLKLRQWKKTQNFKYYFRNAGMLKRV